MPREPWLGGCLRRFSILARRVSIYGYIHLGSRSGDPLRAFGLCVCSPYCVHGCVYARGKGGLPKCGKPGLLTP